MTVEKNTSRRIAAELRNFFLGGVALTALCATAAPGVMAQEVIQMAPIEVEAQGLRAAQTEGSGSYTTDITTAGSKTPTPVREVPQTVTVMTRQQLDDANLNTLEDAFQWTPGITVATGDTFSASLYSRGHEIFTYAVDGLVRPLLSIYGSAPDMVFFDRVEVLSGPTGLFNGTGEPAGTINLSRKRALSTFGISGSAYGGSYNHYRGEADITGPLNEAGTVRARPSRSARRKIRLSTSPVRNAAADTVQSSTIRPSGRSSPLAAFTRSSTSHAFPDCRLSPMER